MTVLADKATILLLLPWAALWLAGGLWLARVAFRLRPNEEMVVGIATGWILQNWLANFFAWVMPIPLAFWLAAAAVFLLGGLAGLRDGWKSLGRLPVSPVQLVILGAITFVFFEMSRGLAIFDDFAHLPTVSMMAAGDFPPHFSLDPQVVYGYHHFLLLFSAQTIRVGGLSPWVAIDAGRAVSFGLGVMLAALWTRRLTRSFTAGVLGGLAMAFTSGTRWLLLLLPPQIVDRLGRNVQLIGSGAESGAGLREAISSYWGVQGAGPIGFPFAFSNGIFHPAVLGALGANGITGPVTLLLLLLTCNRWQNRLGASLSAVLVSVWGLLGEVELALFAAGWALVALAAVIRSRSLRLPATLWRWLGVVAAGTLLGMLSGGAWTDLLVKTVQRLVAGEQAASYQTVGFTLAWPPALVSAHLGVLSLLDPAALFLALLELGPVLLVLPLVLVWGWKAFQLGRWYEAAVAAAALVALGMVFVRFTGSTGVRNTSRLYLFVPICLVFLAPLAWNWARQRSHRVQVALAALGLVTITGGVVLLGIQLVAAQQPVYSTFLSHLDVRITQAYWNRLEPDALVFDPEPYRAPTVFGRPTNAGYTWYEFKPEWKAWLAAPDPKELQAAGFSYVYLDSKYWKSLQPVYQQRLADPCVRLMEELADQEGNFRQLLDIRACR